MLRGSRELVMRAPVVRDITVDFEVHPTMDRHFIYRILGGRIDAIGALYRGHQRRRQREARIVRSEPGDPRLQRGRPHRRHRDARLRSISIASRTTGK